MTRVFADSSYWIALINPRDSLHALAHQEGASREDHTIATSEMVLVEVLNYFAQGTPRTRSAASTYVQQLKLERTVEIVPQTSEQFREALRLYQERQDKSWSLTDCASMLLMRARDMQQVLTEDHHFQQAGFETLLSRQT